MSLPFLLSVVNADKDASGKFKLTSNESATVSLVTKADADKPSKPATISRCACWDFPATHTFDKGKKAYLPNSNVTITPGEWLLVVQAEKRSPVVQRLTLTDEKGFLRAKAGWSGSSPPMANPNLLAATVDLTGHGKAPKAAKAPPVQSTVTVKLFARREFILMSGIETHAGDTFSWRVLPEGRRNILRGREVIGPGDIVTMLHCESRERLTCVRAAAARKWLLIEQFVKSGTKRTTNNFKKEPKTPGADIDIVDFYRCLDEAGQTAPGSVAEASIFSHGFYGGPVLFNTNEFDTADPAPPGQTRRQGDFDGRARDWDAAITLAPFPGVKKALAADGFLKIWGCNALRLLHGMIDTGEKKLKPTFDKDKLLTGSVEIDSPRQLHHSEKLGRWTERTTLRRLLKTDIAEKFRTGYVAAAATFLGKPCFGALPGSGSIHPQDKKTHDYRMVIEPGNDNVFQFYRRELSAADAIDDEGYADFGKLAPRFGPIASPTFSFERFTLFTVIKKAPTPGNQSFTKLQAASGATLWADPIGTKDAFTFAIQKDLVVAGKQGMLFVAALTDVKSIWVSNGLPELVLQPATLRDMGFYVQEDGALYLLTRSPPGTPWALDTRTFTVAGGGTVSNGVLQAASTAFVF